MVFLFEAIQFHNAIHPGKPNVLFVSFPKRHGMTSTNRFLESPSKHRFGFKRKKQKSRRDQKSQFLGWPHRQGGGIEPLHVSRPHELKSCPSTSLTHPGRHNNEATSINSRRAHPHLNQGPADLQSAALTTELCTHVKHPILALVKFSKKIVILGILV